MGNRTLGHLREDHHLDCSTESGHIMERLPLYCQYQEDILINQRSTDCVASEGVG